MYTRTEPLHIFIIIHLASISAKILLAASASEIPGPLQELDRLDTAGVARGGRSLSLFLFPFSWIIKNLQVFVILQMFSLS